MHDKSLAGPVFAVMFTMVVVGIIGTGIARCSADMRGETGHEATKQAIAYIDRMQLDAKRTEAGKPVVSCMNSDTDNDGYVSCTYTTTAGQLEQIECTAAYTFNEGCRLPKAILRGQR
jgi:type II secretory pathway pseudopilin PulG